MIITRKILYMIRNGASVVPSLMDDTFFMQENDPGILEFFALVMFKIACKLQTLPLTQT